MWRRGLLPPGAFIDVAEQVGLMSALGQQVLQMATAQCRAWLDSGLRQPVAVNVSPTQFGDPGFVDSVLATLRAAGLPPELLSIEITESMAMADFEVTVGRAHRQGFRQGERGSRRMAASLGRRLPARGRKSRPNGRQIVAGASRRRPLQAGSNWRRRVACQCASCAASMGRANR